MPSRTARLAGRPAVLLPIDPFDEDTQTAQARDALKECQEAGVYFDPGPEISEKVDCNREKIWGKWERYETLDPYTPFAPPPSFFMALSLTLSFTGTAEETWSTTSRSGATVSKIAWTGAPRPSSKVSC